VYGLFAQDQFQTSYETENYGDSLTPNAMGGQLGLESYVPADEGYVHFALEGYYAQPYMYIKQSPAWSFMRTYTDNVGDNQIFYEWVGSPFGPDTIAGELTVGYEKPEKWSVDLTYLFKAQGKYSEDCIFGSWSSTDGDGTSSSSWLSSWPYPTEGNGNNIYSLTPTGMPKYTNRLSIRGTWYATKWLSFTVQPAYVIIFNNKLKKETHEYTDKEGNKTEYYSWNHAEGTDWGFEIALSVRCMLTKL